MHYKNKIIKQSVNETAWDVDQRLKCLLGQVNFHISDKQHKECYIATLLPHIRLPLSQQKIGTQTEALEIAMKLEASLVQDTHIGVQQIQPQLASLHMELQYLKKRKEARSKMRSEVWCTKCKVEGHYKDKCPIYHYYVVVGGPNPLNLEPSAGASGPRL